MSELYSIPLPLQLYIPHILLAMVGVPLAILLAMAVQDQGVVGAIRRAVLNLWLGRLRMKQMLARRGIDRARYIALTPLPILRRELQNCRHCRSKVSCDSAGMRGPMAGPLLSYCPNTPSLEARWGPSHM